MSRPNIITTHDELFKAELQFDGKQKLASKEVQRYSMALKNGFEEVAQKKLISQKIILQMHSVLEQNSAGFRAVPGTKLQNDQTKEVIYMPPQNANEIKESMYNLMDYINNDALDNTDTLIKMAIIHHQFESIHPFYDGNGRLGRIVNILYLISKGLLDYPTLYLSRYIIQNKTTYYRLLQDVRTTNQWEDWILFILEGVCSVSKQSVQLIYSIKEQMQLCKNIIRTQYPKMYSQDLINNLFKHPYTKIDFVQKDLKITRQTASKYLELLAEDDSRLLTKEKVGRNVYYVNNSLVDLFMEYDYKLN